MVKAALVATRQKGSRDEERKSLAGILLARTEALVEGLINEEESLS